MTVLFRAHLEKKIHDGIWYEYYKKCCLGELHPLTGAEKECTRLKKVRNACADKRLYTLTTCRSFATVRKTFIEHSDICDTVSWESIDVDHVLYSVEHWIIEPLNKCKKYKIPHHSKNILRAQAGLMNPLGIILIVLMDF